MHSLASSSESGRLIGGQYETRHAISRDYTGAAGMAVSQPKLAHELSRTELSNLDRITLRRFLKNLGFAGEYQVQARGWLALLYDVKSRRIPRHPNMVTAVAQGVRLSGKQH